MKFINLLQNHWANFDFCNQNFVNVNLLFRVRWAKKYSVVFAYIFLCILWGELNYSTFICHKDLQMEWGSRQLYSNYRDSTSPNVQPLSPLPDQEAGCRFMDFYHLCDLYFFS